MKGIAHARYGRSLAAIGLFALLIGLSGCEGWTPNEEATLDPSRFRRALVSEQERLVRFVVGYVRRQETIRAGKRLDRAAVDRLFEEALQAYERAYGVEGAVVGYRRAQLVLAEARSGDRLAAWWDSLGLDAEQQVWMARLWEVFRTSHTVAELDERLTKYERAMVEALGEERSGVLLRSAGVLYSFAVLVFGREEWVEAFWVMVRELAGEDGGGGGMARWGVLGGRGWFRLAQQNATCELNSMPQIGDYRTLEGLISEMLTDALLGCSIGAAFGGVGFIAGAVEGCMAGIVVGTVVAAWSYYFSTRAEYEVDLNRWCRENYTVCQYNEWYRAACEEIINPQ